MAQERLPSNQQEHQQPSPEALREAAEHQERLGQQYERQAEKSAEKNRELERQTAEKDALQEADSKEVVRQDVAERPAPPERRGAPSKEERAKAFSDTMSSVRQGMKAPARGFSKLIHSRPVEVASEAIGSTVARPNAIVAASAFALVFTTIVYLVSRYYGYPLSGFESIGSFALGWCLGLLYDYVRSGLSAKRNR